MEPAGAVSVEARRRALSRFYSLGPPTRDRPMPSFLQQSKENEESSSSSSSSSSETAKTKKRKKHKDEKKTKRARHKEAKSNPRKEKHSSSNASVLRENNANIGSESCRFGKPIRPINQAASFDRSARFAASCHRSYASFMGELANPKEVTYNNPRHQVRGLNGNARFARIKEALEGFENKPIELQMRMHQAAFSVEGPLIWGEEYFNNTKLILEREGWTAKISLLFVLTQRKMGKTCVVGSVFQ